MRTTVQVTVAPEKEPVALDRVKQHCRVDNATDDLLLMDLVATARIMAEGYLGRSLITQTIRWTVRPESMVRPARSVFPPSLNLPRSPVQSISSVVALDALGNSTTIAAASLPIVPPALFTGYIADLTLEPARLRLGWNTVLSDGRLLGSVQLDHVAVTMIAGYGDPETVPRNIVQAILLYVAFLYENRGDDGGEIPKAVERLLDRDRLQFLGG